MQIERNNFPFTVMLFKWMQISARFQNIFLEKTMSYINVTLDFCYHAIVQLNAIFKTEMQHIYHIQPILKLKLLST